MAGHFPGREFESRPVTVIFPGNETNLPHIVILQCFAIAARRGAGEETCMNVLVTIADVKLRP